jgi:CCR4-NOT transcription complex subunit 6
MTAAWMCLLIVPSHSKPTASPSLLLLPAVPPGQTLTSGVYSLLAGCGQPLPSTHPDHPAQRQQRGGGGGGASHAQQAAQAAQLGQLAGVRLSSGALCLESAAVAAWGREAPVTNKTASFAGCLDYVWLSRGHWAVSAALHPPYRFDRPPPGQPAQVADPGDVSDLPPIPNQHFPSDHLALGFRLHMLPPGGDGGH